METHCNQEKCRFSLDIAWKLLNNLSFQLSVCRLLKSEWQSWCIFASTLEARRKSNSLYFKFRRKYVFQLSLKSMYRVMGRLWPFQPLYAKGEKGEKGGMFAALACNQLCQETRQQWFSCLFTEAGPSQLKIFAKVIWFDLICRHFFKSKVTAWSDFAEVTVCVREYYK